MTPPSLRILHVLEPGIGGVPAWVSAVAAAQARRGHRVTAMVPADLGHRYRAAFVGCRLVEWRPTRRSMPALARAVRRVANVVATEHVDVAHLHSSVAGMLVRPWWRARPDTALVYQPHGLPFTMVGPLAPALRGTERLLARRTDMLLAVSEREARALRDAGVRSPVWTTSVPVDLERFRPATATERRAARDRLGLAASVRVVVSIGRITRAKGQDLLVEQWRRHHGRVARTGAQLFLVGGGAREEVAAWAGSALGRSVHHVGDVEDVWPWLAVADVAVQASRWEGMSLGVAESLACALPVVATDVSGMQEMIGGGIDAAGEVVPRDRPDALLPAVLRRLQGGELVDRERRTARRRALELFDVEHVTDRVLAAYGSATGRSAGSD